MGRVQSSALVLLAVLLVLFAATRTHMGGAASMELFSREAEPGFEWRRGALPPDRWIGLVLDHEGWSQLDASEAPLAGAPPDFDQEIAVVASLGVMPSGGYAVRVRRVTFAPAKAGKEAQVIVEIQAAAPAPDAFVTLALTHPRDVVTIPRSAWPAGALRALDAGEVSVAVVDQDGRDWGPGHVLGTVTRP